MDQISNGRQRQRTITDVLHERITHFVSKQNTGDSEGAKNDGSITYQ